MTDDITKDGLAVISTDQVHLPPDLKAHEQILYAGLYFRFFDPQGQCPEWVIKWLHHYGKISDERTNKVEDVPY